MNISLDRAIKKYNISPEDSEVLVERKREFPELRDLIYDRVAELKEEREELILEIVDLHANERPTSLLEA
jgi:hypothetical protein